jgi:hypothetical protein
LIYKKKPNYKDLKVNLNIYFIKIRNKNKIKILKKIQLTQKIIINLLIIILNKMNKNLRESKQLKIPKKMTVKKKRKKIEVGQIPKITILQLQLVKRT